MRRRALPCHTLVALRASSPPQKAGDRLYTCIYKLPQTPNHLAIHILPIHPTCNTENVEQFGAQYQLGSVHPGYRLSLHQAEQDRRGNNSIFARKSWLTSHVSFPTAFQRCLTGTKVDHSLRQFKYRFGGKKKITEKEWTTGIIPEIKKRALEDKESDVYFHGDKLNPKRLKRGIDRYVAEVSRDFMDLDTSTGIRLFHIFSCTLGRSLADCVIK